MMNMPKKDKGLPEPKSSGYTFTKLDVVIEGFRTFADKTVRLMSLIGLGRIDSISYSGAPTRTYSALIRLSQRYYDVRIVIDEDGDIISVTLNRDDRQVTRPLTFQPGTYDTGDGEK